MSNQTFHTDTLAQPAFKAEVEGDTCKINFLNIPLWYTNLDEINTYLSDIELEEVANSFFVDNYEETNSLIKTNGYYIIYKKLCKEFESGREGRGHYIVYIDIQTGEIVYNGSR
jgi:hypothetical protein